MQVDFLIVGQGLAGSLLAWELLQHNCRVLVLDNGDENASQVAAGLINPVTGMRLVKSTDVDILLPYAQLYYAKLGKYFAQSFYVTQPMLRFLANKQEAAYCAKRLLDPTYSAYLDKIYPADAVANIGHAKHPVLQQTQTGYLRTRLLLRELQKYLLAKGCYQQTCFAYADVKMTPILQWRDVFPQRIIFCEGYQGMHNPWFSYLPFQPVKGEILTLRLKKHGLQQMLNFGHWAIPLDKQEFRLGATFDHVNLDCLPTQEAKDLLLQTLAQTAPKLAQAEVIAQHANVRPTTLDKAPFIGHHPQFPKLSIFNGFGAKGSLLIPWYSQQFVRHLLHAETIAPQCDIARCR